MALTAPLADRRYRRLFVAQVIALLGTGLSTIALGLLAYDMVGEAAGTVLGTALALKMVAYMAVAPVVGGVGHLAPRKVVLVTLDLLRAAAALCLPFVTEAWQVYGVIVALNACSAGFTPTFQAAIPDIFPDEERYTQALSLSRAAYDIEALLSPMLAAAALTVIAYSDLFVVNAIAFCLSALLVATVTLPKATPPQRLRGVLVNICFGARAYLRTPRLRGLLALSMAVAAGSAMVIVNTVVLSRDVLGLDESEAALVYAVCGVGSVLGAALTPRLLRRIEDRRAMLWGGAALPGALALGAALFAAAPSPLLLAALWAALGLGLGVAQTPAGRLLKRSAAQGDRPALFAAQFAFSHGCWLICYPLAGYLDALGGTAAAFGGLAAVSALGVVAAALTWRARDEKHLEHEHPATSHEHRHSHDDLHHQHDHEGWEAPEPHTHPHRHGPIRHRHAFVIDLHHPVWPR